MGTIEAAGRPYRLGVLAHPDRALVDIGRFSPAGVERLLDGLGAAGRMAVLESAWSYVFDGGNFPPEPAGRVAVDLVQAQAALLAVSLVRGGITRRQATLVIQQLGASGFFPAAAIVAREIADQINRVELPEIRATGALVAAGNLFLVAAPAADAPAPR
jgi:hypothetical protein